MRDLKNAARLVGLVGSIAMAVAASPAAAQGLSQAQSVATDFKNQIQTIGPIIAVAALILAAVGYMMKFIEKDMFGRIAIGCIIGGSAAALVPMFWTGG